MHDRRLVAGGAAIALLVVAAIAILFIAPRVAASGSSRMASECAWRGTAVPEEPSPLGPRAMTPGTAPAPGLLRRATGSGEEKDCESAASLMAAREAVAPKRSVGKR